jgi:hypothetical protein
VASPTKGEIQEFSRYSLFELKGETRLFPLKNPDVQDEQNAVIERDVEKRPLVLYSNLKIQNQYLQVEWA